VAAAASGGQSSISGCQASSLDGGQLWKTWTRWWCGGSASLIFSPALVGVAAGCAKQEVAARSRRCSRLPCHPRWQLAVFHLLLVVGATLGDRIRAAAVVVGVMAMAAARSDVASALGVVVVGILGGGRPVLPHAGGGGSPRPPDLGGSRIPASTTVMGVSTAAARPSVVMVDVGGASHAGVVLHSLGNLVRVSGWS
jgi:hypothetical protein